MGCGVSTSSSSSGAQKTSAGQGEHAKAGTSAGTGAGLRLTLGTSKSPTQSLVEVVKTIPSGSKFIDKDFPPNKTCLGPIDGMTEENMANIVWVRPEDMMDSPVLVADGVEPGDVCQGGLGDCWWLGGLSVLCTRRDLMDRIMSTDKYKDKGVYAFKFYKFGRWVEVVVDDTIPVVKNSEATLFCCSKDKNELWAILMEKSYAKLHDTYAALEGGWVTDALVDMTGGVPTTFTFEEKAADIASGKFWQDLLGWYASGEYLMGCARSTSGTREQDTGRGILQGHAYGILEVREYKGTKLIRCRNPWGQAEWTGPWSDSDAAKWTPQVLKDLNYQLGDDGAFWIEFSEFTKEYNKIYQCRLLDERVYHTYAWRGEWAGASAGGCMNNPATFWNNPQYRLTVKTKGEVILCLMSPDSRVTGEESHHAGIVVIAAPDGAKSSKYKPLFKTPICNLRENTLTAVMEAGVYNVIAFTFDAGELGPYVLSASSRQAITLESFQATDVLNYASVPGAVPQGVAGASAPPTTTTTPAAAPAAPAPAPAPVYKEGISKLAQLAVPGGSLLKPFDPETTTVNAVVPYSAATCGILVAPASAKASVAVDGVAIKQIGQASAPKALAVGEDNRFSVVCTAEDGSKTTYTVIVQRKEDKNADLAELRVQGAPPFDFSPKQLKYAFAVPSATTVITLSAKAASPVARSIKVSDPFAPAGGNPDDEPDLMVEDLEVTLDPGRNNFWIKVTAQNGSLTTYTLVITRPSLDDMDSSLSSLIIPDVVTLRPTFDKAVTSYTATVPFAVTRLNASATASSAQAHFTIAAPPELAVGPNELVVSVTAKDGGVTAYRVTVTREQPDTNCDLAELGFFTGSVSPAFSPATTTYAATAIVGSAEGTVTAVAASRLATVAIRGGQPQGFRAKSTVPLHQGAAEQADIVVTAQSGATKTYRFSIKVAEPPPPPPAPAVVTPQVVAPHGAETPATPTTPAAPAPTPTPAPVAPAPVVPVLVPGAPAPVSLPSGTPVFVDDSPEEPMVPVTKTHYVWDDPGKVGAEVRDTLIKYRAKFPLLKRLDPEKTGKLAEDAARYTKSNVDELFAYLGFGKKKK
jgi:hypothetical protein